MKCVGMRSTLSPKGGGLIVKNQWDWTLVNPKSKI
jgi:hypothetical protein